MTITPTLITVLRHHRRPRIAAMTEQRRTPDDVVAQAIGGVELAGGQPSDEAIALARQVAAGEIDADTAVAQRIRDILADNPS